MNRETAYVLWFDELRREDVNLVGGKSSSLGELTSSTNVPVPYGFATTAHGYREFMKATGLEDKIRAELDALDDVENSALLREVCAKIRRMICEEVGRCLRECEAEIDKSLALIRYYAKLAPQFLAGKTIATQASISGVSFAPLGVVLAVMPWNYPVWQVLRFAVPALCAGNACLVKPAPSVARVSAALFELADGLPLQPAWLAHQNTEAALAACDALAFTGWQLLFGGLFLLPAALLLETPPDTLTAANIGGYLYLSLFGALFAYALYFRGIAKLPPAVASSLALLSPVCAFVLGWLFLGQSMDAKSLLGFALALASIFGVQKAMRQA